MGRAKKTILIVDDSEMNRALLADMLENDYDILEAENGMEATTIMHEHELSISLVLLDIVMPVMDGFETLALMNKRGWIRNLPVIMISAETGSAFMDKAYGLGAVDYISRPFDERTVRHRVDSNVILGEKQRDLADRLTAQIYEKEKDNRLMIEILSHIVEFRNGESGLHVLHVHAITEMILKTLRKKTDKYKLTQQDISLICNASALHDVGKISIPSEILNKPGRFTPEEFEIMKTHTMEGAKMLGDIPLRANEPLIKIGYEICRWHHERYDGRGYPDGLKGEQIPIAAQVVALADVYDALTATRVYKSAYTPEKALQMILNGECGAFNPLLLECLKDCAGLLKKELTMISLGNAAEREIQKTVADTLKTGGADTSSRAVQLLEHERMRSSTLASLSREIIFEYNAFPEIIKLSDWSAGYLGMPVNIADPRKHEFGTRVFKAEDFEHLLNKLKRTTPTSADITEKYALDIKGTKTWCKIVAKAMWTDTEPPEYEGAIGKIIDINDELEEIAVLELKANTDAKTGLFNHEAAKEQINNKLSSLKNDRQYALLFFDLDNFKQANDNYGHLFGDELLEYVAATVKKNTRTSDISARIGGDEFIIFMSYSGEIEPQIERIFKAITGVYKTFPIKISMGVALTDGTPSDFDTMFEMADKAAYSVKNSGKNSFCFYSDELKNTVTGRNS